jgi:hypothetical protein
MNTNLQKRDLLTDPRGQNWVIETEITMLYLVTVVGT